MFLELRVAREIDKVVFIEESLSYNFYPHPFVYFDFSLITEIIKASLLSFTTPHHNGTLISTLI